MYTTEHGSRYHLSCREIILVTAEVSAAAALESAGNQRSRSADDRRTRDQHIDVWSRWGNQYRIRATVLLAINVLLFGCLGCFAFWLRTGVFFAPAVEGYWSQFATAFNFVGNTDVTLGTLLVTPISVQDAPSQIWILALLMAALIAIPILVTILYRLWAAMPFVAIVGFIALMPWLAITLLISCMVVTAKPFRFRFRFMTALLALTPAVVYLVLASKGTTPLIEGVFDPAERIKFVAPWVLAIVAAAIGFALVLATSRLVNYRPGAITPLLTTMFVLPVVLFEFHIGRDELYYRRLENLDRAWFADVDASMDLNQWTERVWLSLPEPRPHRSTLRQATEQVWQSALDGDVAPAQSQLTRHQQAFVDHCDQFLLYFPDSPYAGYAVMLRARALDRRVDPRALRQEGWIRFLDDYPSPASRHSWASVVQNWPDSAPALVAGVRLAQFHARDGEVSRALDRLDETIERFGPVADAASLQRVVASTGRTTNLSLNFAKLRLQACNLRDLLRNNRDPVYLYDPVAGTDRAKNGLPFGMLDLVPGRHGYAENLSAIKHAYPRCQLADNLDLEIAKSQAMRSLKLGMLNDLLIEHPTGDAIPEALYRLGVSHHQVGDRTQAQRFFDQLQERHSHSIWAQESAAFSRRSFVRAGDTP